MAAKKAKGTAVAKKEAGALVAGQIDEAALLEDTEAGDHGFTQEDILIPFVRILQKLSPQVDKDEPEFIEGAEIGDFLQTDTKVTYSGGDGIFFVPAVYTINYTEWHPRESGGGMVANHGTDRSCLRNTTRDEKNRAMTPAGTLIATSALYFGFIVDLETGDRELAVLSLSSTQLKKSRDLNSRIQKFKHTIKTENGPRKINPRMWFHLFKCTTIPESNDQGKWMGWKIERVGSILEYDWGHAAYEEARELATRFASGEVKAQVEESNDASNSAASGDDNSSGDAADDDAIPF
jgi:hypothetical protein